MGHTEKRRTFLVQTIPWPWGGTVYQVCVKGHLQDVLKSLTNIQKSWFTEDLVTWWGALCLKPFSLLMFFLWWKWMRNKVKRWIILSESQYMNSLKVLYFWMMITTSLHLPKLCFYANVALIGVMKDRLYKCCESSQCTSAHCFLLTAQRLPIRSLEVVMAFTLHDQWAVREGLGSSQLVSWLASGA